MKDIFRINELAKDMRDARAARDAVCADPNSTEEERYAAETAFLDAVDACTMESFGI
jgi:hypothetical protein